jgi:hypothetical protein
MRYPRPLFLAIRASSARALMRADWNSSRAVLMSGSLDIFSIPAITAAQVFSSFAIRRVRSISGDSLGRKRRRSSTAAATLLEFSALRAMVSPYSAMRHPG